MDGISAEAWLTQEADDLLEAGPAGLYEFIWRLNGTAYGLNSSEARELSRDVVRRILRDQRAQLFAVQWPTFAIVSGPLSDSVLEDAESWSEGEEGPLVALVPVEDIDRYRSQPC